MTAQAADMLILSEFYRYNAWANARVFAACAPLDAAVLRQEARGTHGTIETTLKHLVGVEDAFLVMLQGLPLGQGGAQETYLAHDLAWFAQRAAELGERYLRVLAGEGETLLTRALDVPWFTFAVSGCDALLQVLSHSSQHRAQVLSVLGAQGVEVPNIDYIFMIGGEL